MRITERQLRKIIREVISEGHSQELMNEGLKDVTREALLAAMVSLGVANAPGLATKVFHHLKSPNPIEMSASHEYKGMKGEELVDHILKNEKIIRENKKEEENEENIVDSDLVLVSICLREYDVNQHSSTGSQDRHELKRATGIITTRIEQADQSIVGQDQMYSVGRKTR